MYKLKRWCITGIDHVVVIVVTGVYSDAYRINLKKKSGFKKVKKNWKLKKKTSVYKKWTVNEKMMILFESVFESM
jgi:hypothetical protein